MFLAVFLVFMAISWAQEGRATLSGVVRDGQPIAGAAVLIKGTNIGTETNGEGRFTLNVPEGRNTLVVSYLGKKTFEKAIRLKAGEHQTLEVILEDSATELTEIELKHISPVQRINKSAYNAVAISAKELKKTNTSVADMLAKVSGIKIRETGGLGSATQINLNGFTGKHIRIFIDGVQFNHENSAYEISNIPTDIVEYIEVYKGVVPIEFGEDALGGAINIVTKQSTHRYGYLSYTYGSFNTHKSALGIAERITPNIALELQAYQNYSDNNYKVKTKYFDFNTNSYSKEEKWFKRFNDRFHNEVIVGKAHFFDEKWTDKLTLSMHYSQMHQQIQNTNLMQIVLGERYTKGHNYSTRLEYEKMNLLKNFNVYLTGRYDIGRTQNIDDAFKDYTWDGSYRPKADMGERGATHAIFKSRVANVTSKFEYLISESHNITLTNAFNEFIRDTEDDLKNVSNNSEIGIQRGQLKNVTGLSYKYSPNERFDIIVFGKHYYSKVRGPFQVPSPRGFGWFDTVTDFRDVNADGYGTAISYQVTKPLQLMASYEKTYRLPHSFELFGDGNFEDPNVELKPEHSHNINFNISYNPKFGNGHSLLIEPGFTYRNVNDYIRRSIDGGVGKSINHGKTLSLGADITARYFYKDRLSVGGNISYMDMRNKQRYDQNGVKAINYDDRIPNVPYFFGTVDGYYAFRDIFRTNDDLSLYYAFNYTKEFFLTWQSEGAKLSVPDQYSHDINLIYTPAKKKYSVAFEVRNFTDALLYDEYSLQKPGRAFYVKLRYNLF